MGPEKLRRVLRDLCLHVIKRGGVCAGRRQSRALKLVQRPVLVRGLVGLWLGLVRVLLKVQLRMLVLVLLLLWLLLLLLLVLGQGSGGILGELALPGFLALPLAACQFTV